MDSCWEIDRNEWRDNAQVILGPCGDHVAEAYGEDGLALKRARFIAAAPEMYDALHAIFLEAKQIVIESSDGTGHCKHCGIGDGGQHDSDCIARRVAEFMIVACAAILMAHGREVKTHA